MNQFFLESVDLSYELLTIGKRAFANCVQLKEFSSKADKLIIHEKAFAQCVEMTTFKATGIQLAGESVFANCKRLDFNVVTFFGKVPENSFLHCIGMLDLKFADDIEIAKTAFLGCKELSMLTFLGNAKLEDGTLEDSIDIQIRCPKTSNLVNLAFKGFHITIF